MNGFDQDLWNESKAHGDIPTGHKWTPDNDILIPWSRVCKTFERDDVLKRHPGWVKTLSRCSIFDLTNHPLDTFLDRDGTDMPPLQDEPLPFPEITMIFGWQVIVLRNFWTAEGQQFGAEMAYFRCPFKEVPKTYMVTGTATVAVNLSAPPGVPQSTVTDAEITDVVNGKPRTTDDLGVTTRAYRDGESGCATREELHEYSVQQFAIALAGLYYINRPNTYIVENNPKKTAKPKKGKIPRIHSRPKYILLEKEAIHKRYLDSQPSGRKSPVPHLRRGHYRTLTDKRYKDSGRQVWVRATHIKGNDVEWRDGDRYYKVI